MSSQNSEVGNVVSELLRQAGDLISSITNDEDKQLRVVFNESEGTRDTFESDIESIVGTMEYEVDFVELDEEYLAIVSLE